MDGWTPLELPTGAYSDPTRPWTHQDVCGYATVAARTTGTASNHKLRTLPGLVDVMACGDGPHRGAISVEGVCYFVSGDGLYRAAPDFSSSTRLGTVSGYSRVQMAYNKISGGNQLLIANGTASGWVWDTVAQTFTAISDSGFVGFVSCDFLNQYIIGVDPSRTFWYTSELADATQYNTFDRYQPGASPNKIVGLIASHNSVFVFGERVIEQWVNSVEQNDVSTAFQLSTGTTIERGCLNGDTIKRLDNSIFFVGDDRIVYRLRGYVPEPVSTQSMTASFYGLDASHVFAYTWEDEGHVVYYLTWGNGSTWGYDCSTGLWHRRESPGMDRCRLASLVRASNGQWYGGESAGNRVFRLDWSSAQDAGLPLPRKVGSGVIRMDGNRFAVNGLRLLVNTGQPSTTGADEGLVVQVRSSSDGGNNWTQWRDLADGKTGNFVHDLVATRFGRHRWVMFEFRDTSTYRSDVLAASARVTR